MVAWFLNPNLDGGEWFYPPPPVGFAEFSNILLETAVLNLVFLNRLSVQMLGKTQTRVFPISRFLVKPL